MRRVIFLSLLAAAPCFSEGLCTLEDNLHSCSGKVASEIAASRQQADAANSSAEADQQRKLGQVNTGVATAVSTLPTSSTNDFFSLFKLGAAAQNDDAEGDDAWAMELNKCSAAHRQPRSVQCQIRVRTGDASLYEPLKQALPESTRAARATELESGIGDFDNATIGLFVNLANERFGRQLRYGADPLYQQVFDIAARSSEGNIDLARQDLKAVSALLSAEIRAQNAANHETNVRILTEVGGRNPLESCPEPAQPAITAVRDEDAKQTAAIKQLWNAFCALQVTDNDSREDRVNDYNSLLAKLQASAAALKVENKTFNQVQDSEEHSLVPFKDLRGAAGHTALQLAETAVRRRLDAAQSRANALADAGFFDLYRLANNQPQLNFGVEATVGSKLTGPDELRARLSWEVGWANLNDLEAFASHECTQTATSQEDKRAACLREYLDNPDVAQDLAASDRVALIVEYVRRSSYSARLADDNVTLELPSEKSLVGSLVYGRYLSLAGLGSGAIGKTRVDLLASYEDVRSDPLRRDRGLGTLTFSQELTNGFVLSLSAVYATQPEFRGTVDKEWSSRLGLNYKLAPPTAK